MVVPVNTHNATENTARKDVTARSSHPDVTITFRTVDGPTKASTASTRVAAAKKTGIRMR
jgi:hypothetical protein